MGQLPRHSTVSQVGTALERSRWRNRVALSEEVDKPSRDGLVDRVGDRGVALTDDPGTLLPERHALATFSLLRFEDDPLEGTSIVGLPRSVSCEQLNEAWT